MTDTPVAPPHLCDVIVNNGMGEPTECGRTIPCAYHRWPYGAARSTPAEALRFDRSWSHYADDCPVPPTPAEALDVERLAATEWLYDAVPESFDALRDPVKEWNDRIYPATGLDKERYRRRARAILARLSLESDPTDGGAT